MTPFLPDSRAAHGGGSYLGAICEALSRQADLGLVSLQHPGEPTPASATWAWSGGAAYDGAPRGATHRLRMLWRWRRQPLLVAKHSSAAFAAAIAEARRTFRPDVALVEMAQMAQYLPCLRGLPTVLTDHEGGRPANSGTGLGAVADRRDDRLWQRYVRRYYPMADRLQAVTDEDASSLSRALGAAVDVRPPAIAPLAAACAPEAAPPAALFLGDYRHQPNREAAQRLAGEVWPLVRARHPDAELLLAGPNEGSIRPLDGRGGVRVVGFVADLRDLMNSARLVLAPLWSGGGFRVKNATALLSGLPVVTNALGARGCRAPEPGCTVRETAADLAEATCKLLSSAEAASAAGAGARAWAQERFGPDAVAAQQLARLEALLAAPR
ncbi:MAG: glycosyltransferase family 4 protein [Planctomycetota bacterium]|nr:glycosyltransferase family 4 protein [Planctomycetota bacterium]